MRRFVHTPVVRKLFPDPLRLLQRVDPQWLLVPMLAFAVLWRGGKGLEMTWLLTGVSWLLVCEGWLRRGRSATPIILWSCAIGLLVWTALAYGASSTRNYGLDEVLRDGSCLLLFLWMIRSSARDDAYRDLLLGRIVGVLATAALCAALIGAVVYLVQPVDRFVGTFFDHRFHTDYWPNAWADFLLLAWPLGAVRVAAARTGPAKRFHAVVLGILVGALLLSFSRGALIAAAGQCVLAGLLLGRRAYRHLGTPLFVTAIVAIAAFFAMNLLRSPFHAVQDTAARVTFTAADGTTSVDEREQFWRQALTLAHEKPLLGWGPYSFRFVQPRLQEGVLATSDHPHNVVLKLAMERGLPAAIAFVALVGTVLLIGAWNVVRPSATLTPSGRGVLLAFLLASAGVIAHSLIDYNVQFVGIALPLWLLLGGIAGLTLSSHPCIASRGWVRAAEVLLASMLLILALWETPPMLLSSLGRHADALGRTAEALSWYDAASSQRLSRDLHISRAQLLYRESKFAEAATVLDGFFRGNAQDGRAWTLLAQIRMAQGDVPKAILAYQEAYARAKYNDLRVLIGLIRAKQAGGEAADLAQRKEEFIGVVQAFASAIEQNAHFIALGPNVEAFRDVTDTLTGVYPDQEALLAVLSARVERKAHEERERLASRAPGWMW